MRFFNKVSLALYALLAILFLLSCGASTPPTPTPIPDLTDPEVFNAIMTVAGVSDSSQYTREDHPFSLLPGSEVWEFSLVARQNVLYTVRFRGVRVNPVGRTYTLNLSGLGSGDYPIEITASSASSARQSGGAYTEASSRDSTVYFWIRVTEWNPGEVPDLTDPEVFNAIMTVAGVSDPSQYTQEDNPLSLLPGTEIWEFSLAALQNVLFTVRFRGVLVNPVGRKYTLNLSGLESGKYAVEIRASSASAAQKSGGAYATASSRDSTVYFWIRVTEANPVSGIVIDHLTTDLTLIPSNWIEAVKTHSILHYARRSHGSQLNVGAVLLQSQNAIYAYSENWCALPEPSNALRVWYGQTPDIGDYVFPWDYWETPEGLDVTRGILTANPSIKYSMWSWCDELDEWSEEQVEGYLAAISALEAELPQVRFIYMTGNAQTTGAKGWNRHLRNEQIRAYCRTNNKVLYDFADLDCWYQGVQATTSYAGHTYPVQHNAYASPEYEGTHVNRLSCSVKASALWWLMARLEGWGGL